MSASLQSATEVLFFDRKEDLFVSIQTPLLVLRSAQAADFDDFKTIFCSRWIMQRHGKEKWTETKLREILRRVFVERWVNKFPYGMFSVFSTGHSGSFVGCVRLDFQQESHKESHIKIECLFRDFVTKDYECQAITAIIKNYIPSLVTQNRCLGMRPEVVVAQTSNAHLAKAFEEVGMSKDSSSRLGTAASFSLTINRT